MHNFPISPQRYEHFPTTLFQNRTYSHQNRSIQHPFNHHISTNGCLPSTTILFQLRRRVKDNGKVSKGTNEHMRGWEFPIGQLEFTKWAVWGIILRVDWLFLNKKHELRKNTLSLSRLCALLGESGETTRLKTLRACRKTMKKKNGNLNLGG